MPLQITRHAVEAFATRWRPHATADAAEAELAALLVDATPTRKRTLNRDAWLWIAHTAAGERVGLAVREDTVVTVLPHNGEGRALIDMTVDPDLVAESEDTVAACRRMVLESESAAADERAQKHANRASERATRAAQAERSRRRNAELVLLDFEHGKSITPAALRRARDVLGKP
jgi:hypothetical protein